MEEDVRDWKLRLRYGKLTTAFKHFTVLADGVVGELGDGFECRPGRAWMAKTWAADSDESIDMIRVIGKRIGFIVDGRIEVYVTEPDQPPSKRRMATTSGLLRMMRMPNNLVEQTLGTLRAHSAAHAA